ncbi:MAG: ATP-binding protein [Chlamydiae bacterium]|nr:ATP-binding protein [Chlamydiota bacterium]
MTFKKNRAFPEPEDSYFLFGPRGTGKSTMVMMRHPEALIIDLRLKKEYLRFAAHPDLLSHLVEVRPEGSVIIIDEIQKVPDLLSVIHVLIEQKKRWKFILTGSSTRKLKREGVDLLGGRVLRKVLHPFMASELGEHFVLQEALEYGLLPLRFDRVNIEDMLAAYVSLYIEEEVKAESLIRHIEPFTRFLQSMSFSHASLLNISNVSNECAVKRNTVASWISILEDLHLAYQISIFTNKAKRELSQHPKLYFFDPGVFRAIRPYSIGDATTELEGAALEGLVAEHLQAWKDYTPGKHSLHFWRTRSGVEVDFVLLGPLGFWAIEVKNGTSVHPSDLRSLISFAEDYPEARALLLYRGKERYKNKNILCMSCEEFLRNLRPGIPLLD